MYLDEGIYISWAKLVSQSLDYAYVSLNDGKTPLYMWLVATFSPWFSSTLLAARMISVVAGALTAVIWSISTEQLFGKKARKFYIIFSLVVPYLYFVERMAFVDSLVTGFLSLAFLLWLLAKKYLDKAGYQPKVIALVLSFLTGVSLAVAYMTKTSARIFVIAHVLIGVLWLGEYLVKRRFIKAALVVVVIGIMFAVNRELIGYMRVGAARFWTGIAMKETELTYTPTQIKDRLTSDPMVYLGSLQDVAEYFSTYLVAVLILFFVSFMYLFLNHKKFKKMNETYLHALWLFVYVGLVFSGSVLAGKVIASRYFYPMIPAVLSFATLGAVWLSEHTHALGKKALYTGLALTAVVTGFMVFQPNTFPYAGDEINFTKADISALGLMEIAETVDPANSIIGVTGIWGVKDGSVIYLREKGIESFGIDRVLSQVERLNGQCPSDSVDLQGTCQRLSKDTLLESDKPNKYFYITDRDAHPEILLQIPGVSVVKEYQRPRSELKTYLLKVE